MSEIDAVMSAMQERASGDVAVDELLAGARRQGMRRRSIRRTLIGSGVTAVVVAVGAVAFAQPIRQEQPQAVQQVSPQVELIAALSRSENISFKVKATTTLAKGGKSGVSTTYVMQGALDPAKANGYLKSSDGEDDEVLVEGTKYMRNGRQWLQYKGKYDRLDVDSRTLDGEMSGSVDSEQLLKLVRQADAKVTKTGADTYHFATKTETKVGLVTLSGDITLDADKRVAKLAYIEYPEALKGFSEIKVVLEFTAYGTPVSVEKPTGEIVIVD